ncbi:FtsQ-type POTRA domain-containing protein [Thiorhodococcus mannitoliphagus]|uniref:Cell division protein FtsQ n=2 Tax=Thiorhodococcus mannitoliphagus TaxID=329406 RepID=A0A6P1DQD1_9GAMM|nr:cell division protein FtsQ/DivIB [Thiorhodococcus mannitoliphagus]NEX18876.1 FtsQ-type POTRA domain-containing protein [Thiorhodococcus mannitoliphagus]
MGAALWLVGEWEPRLLPIRLIEVEGELHHHSSRLLQERLSERLSGGILTADLEELQSVAEDLPWVGRASLQRVWPDTIKVRVEEHRPIARWNADGLVTSEGVVFRPTGGAVPAGLPLLEGDDQRAPDVTSRYLKWRDDLMLVGHLIQTLSVDPRGDWRVDLVMGTELRLGTGPVEERLARFIASARQIEAAGQPQVVDLRYSNGFSVKWTSRTDSERRAQSDRLARSGNRG